MSLPPEALAPIQIDQQLTATGWAVHDVKTINLHAQRGVRSQLYFEQMKG